MAQLQSFNPLGAFVAGQQAKQGLEAGKQQAAARDFNLQQKKVAAQRDDQEFAQQQQGEQMQFFNRASSALLELNESQWPAALEQLSPSAQAVGVDMSQFDLSGLDRQTLERINTTSGEFVRNPQKFTNMQRDLETKVQGLIGAMNPETKQPFTEDEARQTILLRSEGIVSKAGGTTEKERSVLDPELGEGITQLEANRKKQIELAGDAAQLSTEIFKRVGAVEENISNMQEGIRLIDEGANTGPIDKWLPSFKESTVQLDNLKNRLGLDVIASVTFGALSEKELRTAFDTAVPPNLNGEPLKRWFQRRIEKQEKLRAALEEGGIFLSEEGNNLPKLLIKRREERRAKSQVDKAGGGQVFNFDAQGNLIQ